MSTKVAFLDRDGVINIDHAYVHSKEQFEFIDGVLPACAQLVKAGYLLIIVTNQSGIGRGYYSEDQFHKLNDWLKKTFTQAKAPLTAIYYCPHHPEKALAEYRIQCQCRKPNPGMFLQAQRDFDIDMGESLMVGDKRSDMQAALAAGVKNRILVGKDGLQTPEPIPECTSVAQNLQQAVALLLKE